MEEEFEILESIYYDDIIRIENTPKPFLEIFLHPTSTDDTEENTKLIKLIMKAYLPPNYPNQTPSFEFPLSQAKGILHEDLRKIGKEVEELAQTLLGEPMLFEIIQFIKDRLSGFESLPTSFTCSICLENFQQTQDTYNLSCYHYFHAYCLSQHLQYMEADIEQERIEAELNRLTWLDRKPNCPDCRAELTRDELAHFRELKRARKPEQILKPEYVVISDEVRQMQKKMGAIFERQKLAGGIIDESKQEIIVLRGNSAEREPVEVTELLEAVNMN